MRDYRGRFSIPGEQNTVSGSVLTDPVTRRISLELDDSLVPDSRPFEFTSHPVLHGRMIDGSDVSLLHCSQTHWGTGAGRDRSGAEAYSCQYWIAGAQVEEDEPFSRIEFTLTDLVAWINWKGFHTYSDFNGKEPVFRAETAPSALFEVLTTRGMVRLRAGPVFKAGHRSAEFGTIASVEVVPHEVVTLEQLLHLYVRPLQDLLTIATGRPQEVLDLKVVPLRKRRLAEEPTSLLDWADVRFARWSDSPPVGESPFIEQMLFSFSDLDQTLSESLEAWFQLDELVHELRTLATGATYRDGMFVDQRFLYAAHAAETYHRRRLGGTERSKKAHKEMLKEITAAAPERHRRWLKEKLAFSNELTFLNRLRNLRENACSTVESVLQSVDGWEEWVRDTRNFNTHFSTPKRKARIARGGHLLALTESLLLLLDDVILAELGLGEKTRSRLVLRTQRYARVSQWFSEFDWSAL